MLDYPLTEFDSWLSPQVSVSTRRQYVTHVRRILRGLIDVEDPQHDEVVALMSPGAVATSTSAVALSAWRAYTMFARDVHQVTLPCPARATAGRKPSGDTADSPLAYLAWVILTFSDTPGVFSVARAVATTWATVIEQSDAWYVTAPEGAGPRVGGTVTWSLPEALACWQELVARTGDTATIFGDVPAWRVSAWCRTWSRTMRTHPDTAPPAGLPVLDPAVIARYIGSDTRPVIAGVRPAPRERVPATSDGSEVGRPVRDVSSGVPLKGQSCATTGLQVYFDGTVASCGQCPECDIVARAPKPGQASTSGS